MAGGHTNVIAVLAVEIMVLGLTHFPSLPAPGKEATSVAVAASVATAVEGQTACRSGYVSLTFDDGPSPTTLQMVRVLLEKQVPATFFMLGRRVVSMPKVVRRVERAGFLIGNHSWGHTDMTTQSSAQVVATLRATQKALRRVGVHPTRLMRPPYGSLSSATLRAIQSAGYVPVLWTIDPRDWQSGTSEQIAARIIGSLHPNGVNIVIQHDGVSRSPISVGAVPIVVNKARALGYCFVALNENGRPGFPTPNARLTATNATEGSSAVVKIRLGKPAGRDTSVLLRTRSVSATVGEDLATINRRVIVPAGHLVKRVWVHIRADGIDENRELFKVTITRAHGLRIVDGVAVGWIRDGDAPPVISGVAATFVEPSDSPTTVDVIFRLSHVSAKIIQVVVETQPGSADASDFTPIHFAAEILPGQKTLVVPLALLSDDIQEPPEQLTVAVVSAQNAVIGTPAQITIIPTIPLLGGTEVS